MADQNQNQRPLFNEDQVIGPYDKSYALSGKIMLSAIVILFFVVVLMVCLHLYARWYLLRARRRTAAGSDASSSRRRRRRSGQLVFHADANNNHHNQNQRGLDAAVLRSLPIFVFAAEEKEAPIECAVCLSEFEPKETGRRLPKCGHSFHTECIDMWFHSHSTCPLCRSPVEPPEIRLEIASEDVDQLPPIVAPSLSSDSNSAQPGFCTDCAAEASSSAAEDRKKKPVNVSIDVPPRNNSELGFDSPASQMTPSFRSPMSRMLSFTRILSREKRNGVVSPSSGVYNGNTTSASSSGSANELDIERGKDVTQ